MKTFSRVVTIHYIAICLIGLFYYSAIEGLSRENNLFKWLLFAWIFISAVLTLVWIVYIFYHWKKTKFKTKSIRITWLITLIIGLLWLFGTGHVAYHFMIIEMGKGIEAKA